jgi:hypothetical protein
LTIQASLSASPKVIDILADDLNYLDQVKPPPLYDLTNDISETPDLADDQVSKAAGLAIFLPQARTGSFDFPLLNAKPRKD